MRVQSRTTGPLPEHLPDGRSEGHEGPRRSMASRSDSGKVFMSCLGTGRVPTVPGWNRAGWSRAMALNRRPFGRGRPTPPADGHGPRKGEGRRIK